jgi:hypothetical protein
MPKPQRERKLTEKGRDYSTQKQAEVVSAEKRKLERQEAERMRGEIDELAGMFGEMKASSPAEPTMDVDMGRGRRRKTRKSTKKSKKKTRKTRKH